MGQGCKRKEVSQKNGQEEKEGDYCLMIRKQGTPSVSDTILNLFFTEINYWTIPKVSTKKCTACCIFISRGKA